MDHEDAPRQSEEKQAFLSGAPSNKRTSWTPIENGRNSWLSWLRIVFEILMGATIVALLLNRSKLATKSLRSSPVPQFPRKMYTFVNNQTFVDENMFFDELNTLHSLNNWLPLSSTARGYVRIPAAEDFDLPKPLTVPIDRDREGPGFMMSVFHQLHCLSYLAEHFQQGYGGITLEKDIAHHSAHCFNYLRQGITCNADITLEGRTEAGPGEGSEHECVDYDALLKWANEHAAYSYWRPGLIGDTEIL